MLTVLLLSALGVAVLAKMNPQAGIQPSAQQTPVIKDSTGGALSGVLGGRARPADYFATGNPQYNNVTPPGVPFTARPVSQMRVPRAAATKSSRGSFTVAPIIQVAGTSAVSRVPSGTTKPVLSNFVNTRQVSRSTTAPELSQPFWARRFPTK